MVPVMTTTTVATIMVFSAIIISGFTEAIIAIATPGVRIAATTRVVEATAPITTLTTVITVSRFMEMIDLIMIEETAAKETKGWETAKARTVAP